MKGFKIYMRIRKYASSTIEMNCRYITEFKNWLLAENMTVETVTYNDILAFVDYCRAQGNSWTLANHKLLAIRHYYGHLQKSKNIKNPASGIVLKGKTRTVINNLLNKTQLEELFEKYQIKDHRTLSKQNNFGVTYLSRVNHRRASFIKTRICKIKRRQNYCTRYQTNQRQNHKTKCQPNT